MNEPKTNRDAKDTELPQSSLEPEHIEQMLATPELGVSQIAALLGEGPPNIDLLLYIAEHPVLVGLERNNRLPEALETALVEAFFRVMPQLGVRAYGPLASLRDRTRARLDAERRKYELVDKYVSKSSQDAERAQRLLRNYLETDPAPIFVSALRTKWPEWVGQAEEAKERGEGLEILVSSAALIDALVTPADASPAKVAEVLEQMARAMTERAGSPSAVDLLLRRALKNGTPQAKLVAGALATFGVRIELARDILGAFLASETFAPQFAVMAARIEPLMARNTFAQYLVDIASQNPEEPEAKLTAERTQTILSARSVLPLIGSPLAAFDVASFPDTEEFAQLRRVPGTVSAMWQMWEVILA